MMHSMNDWLQNLVASLETDVYSPSGDKLPSFPSRELQVNTTGLSAEAALQQAYAFYQDVLEGAQEAGLSLDESTVALDFGFGWGRISRVFMERLRVANIHGVDVDPAFAELTRALFQSDQFTVCDPFPPVRLPTAGFDLVYSYSVFSHLSEVACQSWMREFSRLLKPGGIVALTTRHESFFDYCQWAASQPDDGSYTAALGRLFPSLDDARAGYARGEFVHASSAGVDGGGPRNASFYGETWIPEAYARARFEPDFRFVRGFFDGERYDQACFVLQKL